MQYSDVHEGSVLIVILFICRVLIKMLRARGTEVYLVSGGFRQLIEPFAEHLGIPIGQIFANRLLFDENGKHFLR